MQLKARHCKQAERAGARWKPSGPRRGERLGSQQPYRRARAGNSANMHVSAVRLKLFSVSAKVF